ncbi:hypothetical protein IAQ61_002150 [Plenodomus lingam]|uniref:uncharacterized protein n=1 Tax=Leptosphaeria maculans TaxID=5022 RepID=UPI00331C8B03|nr:hypothetical protein IAQ61_002150 [Plenodomus lingam]
MQYFASQLRNEQQTTHSLRASHYRKKHKARRGPQDPEEPQSSSSSTSSSSSLSSASPEAQVSSRSYPSSATPEIVQLRLAGLLPEEDDQVPAAPFPHAPAKTARTHYGYANAHQDMATLSSPLYAVQDESETRSHHGQRATTALKKRHLDVLSTLMHTRLLQGDYERAGRAWGLILRTQVAGTRTVDPRNHDRWGIGAEILLHRNPQPATMQGHQVLEASQPPGDDIFSVQGFELAREYYQRLIVQYPHRRFAPTATDERTFYPAMFSLWIFEVCEKSKRARARFRNHGAERPGLSRSPSVDGLPRPDTGEMDAREEAVRVEELARAMEIAERLDRLVVSPPFDKQISLLQLRAHVSLWMSDLIIGHVSHDKDWNMDSTSENSSDPPHLSREQLTRLSNGQRELHQARAFLSRAETLGAHPQSATMSSVDVRLKEIARWLSEPHDREDESSSLLTNDQDMSEFP